VRQGVALRGPGCGLGLLYELCIGWFSSFNESSGVKSRESLSLYFQFSAHESNHLPLVASSFDLKPCSKHV
jgi:hypothetical protein